MHTMRVLNSVCLAGSYDAVAIIGDTAIAMLHTMVLRAPLMAIVSDYAAALSPADNVHAVEPTWAPLCDTSQPNVHDNT